MENPKSIHRFLLALVGVCTAAVVGLSIYSRDFYILLGWFAALALFFVLCAGLALFNVVVLAPIFWLIGKVTDRRAKSRNQSSDAHVA